MASKSTLKERGGIRRELEFARGAVKSAFLPSDVVFIVHKPGYAKFRRAVEQVYRHYGIRSLLVRPTRFSPEMVAKNYQHIFRKAGPEVEKKIMDAYAAVGMSNNIAVEFLHVPKSAVEKVKAANAWDAIKKIAGTTNPTEAADEMQRGGHITIRGSAFVYGGRRPTSRVANMVHVPDAARRVIDSGYLTGRFTDTDLFVPASVIAKVRRMFKAANLH